MLKMRESEMSEIWKYFKKLFPLEAEKMEFYVEHIHFAEEQAKRHETGKSLHILDFRARPPKS